MFVRSYNPVWYAVDLDGVQFDDTYFLFVLNNTFPYNFSPVFHDNQGETPWSQPIQFLANGTLPTDIFFDPTQVYRLEFRKGNTQTDPLIYVINDYVPDQSGGTPTPGAISTSENQVINQQFAFLGTYNEFPITLTEAGDYALMPGWRITLTGTGSTTITQVPIAGNQNFPGNPPFVLQIANTGWSSAVLYERYSGNSGIWSNEAVNASLTGISSGSSLPVTLSFIPDIGVPQEIATGFLTTSTYSVIGGGVELPASTSTNVGGAGYVDFAITLPPTGTIKISNIQLVSGGSELVTTDPTVVPFVQETLEMQLNKLFGVYSDDIFYKQIPSYLVGWDFPLNPTQFLGASVAAQAVGANKSYYVWDQTILFQTVDSSITTSRGTSKEIVLTAAVAGQVAMIQYLETAQAVKLLNQYLSVNIAANAVANAVPFTMSLWYTTDSSLPSTVGSNNSLVATLDADGKPATFNGNWVELKNINGNTATGTIPVGSGFTDFPFSGYKLDQATADTVKFFAIVIGTKALAVADALHITSVGLNAGNIPTRPAPQSFDEVYRECQYYYEKSYEKNVLPGSATANGAEYQVVPLTFTTSTTTLYRSTIKIRYRQTKYSATPTVSFWALDGTASRVYVDAYSGGSTTITAVNDPISNYTQYEASSNGISLAPNSASSLGTNGSAPAAQQGRMYYQYVADSRLGF